ncbi:MAG: hypothetical protein H7842_12830 [Gammaproteobacteria bacterium SHHR-1]
MSTVLEHITNSHYPRYQKDFRPFDYRLPECGPRQLHKQLEPDMTKKQAVLAAVAAHAPITSGDLLRLPELSERLDIDERVLRDIIWKAKRDGLISRDRNGDYRPTEIEPQSAAVTPERSRREAAGRRIPDADLHAALLRALAGRPELTPQTVSWLYDLADQIQYA